MPYHWRNALTSQSILVGWQIVLQGTGNHRKRDQGLISVPPLLIPLPKRVEFLFKQNTSILIDKILPDQIDKILAFRGHCVIFELTDFKSP